MGFKLGEMWRKTDIDWIVVDVIEPRPYKGITKRSVSLQSIKTGNRIRYTEDDTFGWERIDMAREKENG